MFQDRSQKSSRGEFSSDEEDASSGRSSGSTAAAPEPENEALVLQSPWTRTVLERLGERLAGSRSLAAETLSAHAHDAVGGNSEVALAAGRAAKELAERLVAKQGQDAAGLLTPRQRVDVDSFMFHVARLSPLRHAFRSLAISIEAQLTLRPRLISQALEGLLPKSFEVVELTPREEQQKRAVAWKHKGTYKTLFENLAPVVILEGSPDSVERWVEQTMQLFGVSEEDEVPHEVFFRYCLGCCPTPVRLNCYDLAATASVERFVGQVLFGLKHIWHSGLVVHGREYWYGGAINQCQPGNTPFGLPSMVLHLGYTLIARKQLVRYIKETLALQYREDNYDVLGHNCNNFSDECSVLLLGRHIPDYVLHQAEEILKSSWARMLLKPLLTNVGSAPGGSRVGSQFAGSRLGSQGSRVGSQQGSRRGFGLQQACSIERANDVIPQEGTLPEPATPLVVAKEPATTSVVVNPTRRSVRINTARAV